MIVRILSAILFLTPSIIFAASPSTFKELVDYLVGYVNIAIGMLVTTALIIYFWGVVKHIYKDEEGGGQEMRYFLLYGVVILFVMVSIWGILELLDNTIAQRPGSGATIEEDVFLERYE